MKILHCCLSCFYIDNYTYQENILPKFHKAMGYEVEILASTETFIDNKYLGYIEPGCYENEHGIKVTRIPYKRFCPHKIATKIREYEGVDEYLKSSRPDIIFFHGPCAKELLTIVNYVKESNCQLYIDGHEDKSNSAKSFASHILLHQLIYRPVIKKAEPFVTKFWGTLPVRCQFLEEEYGISHRKIDLLVMGADDDEVARVSRPEVRSAIRARFGFAESDFVVVTGGKIDANKPEVLHLMRAVLNLGLRNVKLLVFGPVVSELREEFEKLLAKGSAISYIAWAGPSEAYDYFSAADLIVFPGKHSVYWEQAAALGVPLLLRRLKGADHIAQDSAERLEDGSVSSIESALGRLVRLWEAGDLGGQVAKRPSDFLYSRIAKKSIGLSE